MAFPGTYNFKYYRGDTFSFKVYPLQSTGGISFDLAGYTASFVIANKRGSGATQYTGTAAVDSSADTVTCTITPAVGRNLAQGTYVYDVQIQNSNGSNIFTLLSGSITSTDDIIGAV
jgi:hypothetical protein